jgi:hypothetical protein
VKRSIDGLKQLDRTLAATDGRVAPDPCTSTETHVLSFLYPLIWQDVKRSYRKLVYLL